MDTKPALAILREHSEQLRKLTTELDDRLGQLEQGLAEPQPPSETDAGSRLAELTQ
jgi:hypothetical protein